MCWGSDVALVWSQSRRTECQEVVTPPSLLAKLEPAPGGKRVETYSAPTEMNFFFQMFFSNLFYPTAEQTVGL